MGRTASDCTRALQDRALAAKPWLVTEQRSTSFGQLRIRIGQVAALLREHGLGIGDRVVVATRDDTEAALLFVALICNGITVVNLDPDAGPERAASLVSRAAPRLVLIDSEVRARWSLTRETQVLELSASAPRKEGLFSRLRGQQAPREGLQALLDALTPAEPPASIPAETLAYILFTSGTTSEPKGVSISHRALFAHLATLERRYRYDAGSRILNTLMLAHADGMIQGPVMGFFAGIPVHRPLRFEVTAIDLLLDAIYQLRITHMIAVPTMMSLILRLGLDHRDAFKSGDFKLLVSCGAQLEAALCEDFEKTFGVPIVNVYGLTETVVGGVFSGPDAASRLPGGIGLPEDCELKLADASGVAVAEGESGELWMRGSLLMSGYFEAPALTAEVLVDGWLRTGDIARRDEAGRYTICGRAKNIIIRGGYNIHPEEITEVLQRHPDVVEAVTVGVPDPVWGEVVVSAVVAPDSITNEVLLAHCAAHLEPRKIPSRLQRCEALPRGLSGKVRLEAVRALIEGAEHSIAADQFPPANADLPARVLKVAAASFKTDATSLSLASVPREVPGWDSLAHLEFVVALETEFGIKLSSREIMSLDRLDKVLPLVQRSNATSAPA